MKKPQIVGIGEVVFDIFPDSRKLGGAPADFLHYAVNTGAEGHLISAIGADDLGREIISELNKFNVNPVLAVTPYPSGRVLIFKSPDGVHSAHILENAAWDYIPFTQNAEDCIKNADAVYFGTLALRKAYSKETILDLIDAAPENAIKYFDINLRQNYFDKDTIIALLNKATILKLNLGELKILKGLLNLRGANDDMCHKLKKLYNLDYIIVSDAVKETKIFGENDVTCIKNTRIHSSFAFGLGNAFGGAFITSILKGLSQKEAHEIANKTALEVYHSIKG
jgi:fructokinase